MAEAQPSGEKKGLAMLVAPDPSGEGGGDDSGNPGVEAAADAAFQAVQDGDRQGFRVALMDLVEMIK